MSVGGVCQYIVVISCVCVCAHVYIYKCGTAHCDFMHADVLVRRAA